MDSLAEWQSGGTRTRIAGTPHTLFVRHDGPEDGPDVTLLHGFPSSSHDWVDVLPFLTAAGFRVMTLDFLGFGGSDKPKTHDYSLLEQADLVEAVWAEAAIGRTALVAHDYGVSVAQELLARDPDRIVSVTWLNGGLFADLHRPTRGQKLLHGRLGPLIARGFTEVRFASSMREIFGRPVDDATLHEMWLALSANDGHRIAPRILRYIDERRVHAGRWAQAMKAYPGNQEFIWGPVDPVSGGHVIPRISETVPDAPIRVLDETPAVGHYPQVEAPEIVGPLIADSVGRAQ